MTDRDRLIELLVNFTPHKDPIKQMADRMIIEKIADYLLANGVIVPPCKVGDKVAVRACCECVFTIPDSAECDNANERIFNTTVSSVFNDGFGWKITFKNLSIIEASFADMGTSFFIGENAEQQAREYEQALKERGGE